MQVIINPEQKDWKVILQRPYADNTTVLQTVQEILADVRGRGDKAIRDLTRKFTGVAMEDFLVSEEEIETAAEGLPQELKEAINQAKRNIEI
ncbi:MAG TPA: histidinol dehydrogenase, partial [Flavisolibacter sp.]|nr:histidinol dehydrogenase [Flavisolibacter sp.]